MPIQEEYLKQQFRQNVKKRSSFIIMNGFLIFFFLYAFLKIFYTYTQIDKLLDSEDRYLAYLGNNVLVEKSVRVNSILTFLQTTSKLFSIMSPLNVNESSLNSSSLIKLDECNQEIYLCYDGNYTIYEDYLNLITSGTKYLKTNKYITSIFIINSNHTLAFNLTHLGFNQQNIQKNNFIQTIASLKASNAFHFNQPFNLNNFIFQMFSQNSTINYELICTPTFINSSFVYLCVIEKNYIIGKCFKSKNIFVKNLYSSNQNIIANFPSFYEVSNYINILLTQTIPQFFMPSSTSSLTQCLIHQKAMYKTYSQLDLSLGVPIRCKSQYPQLNFNLFGPYYTFNFYEQKWKNCIDSTNCLSQGPINFIYLQLFVSSNSTFYKNIKSIIDTNIQEILSTKNILLVTFLFLLILLNYSIAIIQNILIPNINFLQTLCQITRNKEQKQFFKLVDNFQPDIFQFIIDYFKKFFWLNRLQKLRKKDRYKKILLEGINLFQYEDYLPVFQYTYRELIRLEKQRITKLQKYRELPHKKKQLTAKINQAIIMKIIETKNSNLQNKIENKVEKRKKKPANLKLLYPDDDYLMNNINISVKGNRGVRFSNDIQTIEIDQGPIIRKSKFANEVSNSCQTIKDDLSEEENGFKRFKEDEKSIRQDEQSLNSLGEPCLLKKKQSSSVKSSRSIQSLHADLNLLKLDYQNQLEEVFSDNEIEEDEIYKITNQNIAVEIDISYSKIIDYYEKIIEISKKYPFLPNELNMKMNNIYKIILNKYQIIYEHLRERYSITSTASDEVFNFQDFHYFQDKYVISNQLMQEGEILRYKINNLISVPISFKVLELMSKSKILKVRLQARYQFAQVCSILQPHLDLTLLRQISLNLKQQLSSNSIKVRCLDLLMQSLKKYPNFVDEIKELKSIKQFYNCKNKKFHFIVSLHSMEHFTPLLTKFYDLIDNFDIINIYNLEMQTAQMTDLEISEPTKITNKRKTIDNIKFLIEHQKFIEMFSNFITEKSKEKMDKTYAGSSKTINRRLLYEKDFNEIITKIDSEDSEYSKYVVVILGNEIGNNYSSGDTDQSSSFSTNRNFLQKLHQDISKIMQKGYFHMILIVNQLYNSPTMRYGWLKKYIRLSPQLLEIDLNIKNTHEDYDKLAKYLQRN